MSTGVIVHETCTLRNPLPPNSPPNGRKTPANGKTTTMGTGTFVVEMTFAQIKPAKINLSLFGRSMLWRRSEPVPSAPGRPERGATRTLVRERRFEGRDGVLGAGAASSLKVVLDQVADGSGVVDVDGSGREAGVEGLACQGLVAGKSQRAAVDQVE